MKRSRSPVHRKIGEIRRLRVRSSRSLERAWSFVSNFLWKVYFFLMKSSAFKFKRFTFFVAKNRDKQWVVIKKYWGDLVHWKLYARVYVLTQLHLKFFRVLSRGTSSRSFRASWPSGYSIMVPCDKGSDEFPLLCNFLHVTIKA